MKKIIIIVLLSGLYRISNAQNYVLSPLGIKFPNYTTATRPAANSIGAGTVLYNSTDNTHQFSNGISWLNLLGTTSVPSGLVNQTLRNNGTGWVADGLMQNNGNRLLIGLNNYDSDGLIRVNAGNFSTAIMATSTDYPAITTISTSGVGVSSISTSGSAFIGVSSTADAIIGTSNTGNGIYGKSTSGYGVYAISTNEDAIFAITNAANKNAIHGECANNFAAVYGEGTTNGWGVLGKSNLNSGVFGFSQTTIGVEGFTMDGTIGVKGYGVKGIGVYGEGLLEGVKGISISNFGVYGEGLLGGVYGISSNKVGVRGDSNSNIGVFGNSNTSYGGLFKGRVRVAKGGNGDAGIEFEKSTGGASGGFVGMNGDNEMMIYGFPYGGAIQRWNVNGGSICYATSPAICSDIRLKKDFRDLSNSLSSITQLKGYNYYLKNEKNPNLQTGFIAQEIQKIFPELVNTGSDGYLSVDYTGLIPHLVESVKALKRENEELKSKMNHYENRLEALENLSAKLKTGN
jgi:Chaperone of endosialidase